MTDNKHPEQRVDPATRIDHQLPRSGSAHRRFPIVGIGASAGGLDALRILLQTMPADPGMGFVITQHLDASHPSLLAELLGKFTSMPVRQVESGFSVEPGHIYVIPPNTYMSISDGILLLKPPSDARGMRMPIDRFLSSLAEDQHEQAIGIILTGTGTDGTQGIREVKANGGMVMVQDPETAQYDGMPRSAIATGQADAVLPLERMSEVLISYSRHAYIRHETPALPSLDAGYDPLLVSFHHAPEESRQAPTMDLGPGPEAEIVRQIEDELKTTREELQSTIEELETSNEELKASNEEVMSMNEELQSSNEEHAKLASIVEFSESAIIGMTLDGIVTSWNPGAEVTCGYRADEVVGKSLDPLFPSRDPGEARRIIEAVCSGRRVGPYEAEGLCKDGTRIQLSVSVCPIRDAAGRVIAASTIARDITAQKLVESALGEGMELQDQLTKIAASVPGMICSYRLRPDRSASMPYVSPAIEDLFGVNPEDVAEDFGPILARIHTEDVDHVQEVISESSRTLTPWRDAFRYRHPIKGEIWVEGHSMPSREPDGSTLWHGYVQDITERKLAEQALLDADRRKNEFLAVLGHELRNPLAPIRNAIHVLSQQEALPDKARWAVDLIERQSEQLGQLVNDLLDVARISGLRVQLRKSAVAIQDALEDALLSTAALMEQCEHELESRLPEPPVMVMADPVRLAQIFTNLLRNAVKYTPDGGHIRVTLDQDGQKAVVRVCDDGIGIRSEYMPRLFDFFSRGETEHPNIKDADGLGVGLALSKQLVERHGGTLEASSSGPGLGSEFVVTLPLCSAVTSPAPPVEPKPTSNPQPSERRILVVDDNPDVADSFRVLLETMGHRARTLDSGAEIVAVMRVFRPDVVFLDIAMPEMDGYQVAATIRAAETDPRPLLVAVTGYGQESDRQAVLKAGFDRHLLKPPNPEQIETLLAELG